MYYFPLLLLLSSSSTTSSALPQFHICLKLSLLHAHTDTQRNKYTTTTCWGCVVLFVFRAEHLVWILNKQLGGSSPQKTDSLSLSAVISCLHLELGLLGPYPSPLACQLVLGLLRSSLDNHAQEISWVFSFHVMFRRHSLAADFLISRLSRRFFMYILHLYVLYIFGKYKITI